MPKRTAPPTTRVEDLAGPLPVEVLRGWISGTRSVTRAWEFLKRHLVEGTVLSGEAWPARGDDPVEVAARVDRAKRVVHALAVAAGGRAPGAPWRGDGFTLFFPARAPVEFAIGVALEAHRKLAGGVPVGLCLHRGHFYELGGRLLGKDAGLVEFVADEAAKPGETLITRAVLDLLRPTTRLATARRTDQDHMPAEIHRVAPDAAVPVPLALAGGAAPYPLPYPRAFHEDLCAADGPGWPEVRARLAAQHLAERSVVAASLSAPTAVRPYDILEGALRDGEVALSVARLVPDGGHLIENGGGTVLAAFEGAGAAVDFAWRLARALFDVDLEVQVAVDRGPALLVPGGAEPAGLVGRPAALACTLCRELGEPDLVHLTAAACAGVSLPAAGQPFARRGAGGDVAGMVLDVAG